MSSLCTYLGSFSITRPWDASHSARSSSSGRPPSKKHGGHDLINLKCDPAHAELLRAEYPDILPGFYSDKRAWIACFLDGELPDELLRQLCEDSHRLVLEKLPKYAQREILAARED